MKHIRKFENYQTKKRRDEIIKEAVMTVNDVYKVNTMIDIPQSLINAYVKKVKDQTGKNLKQLFGDVIIAEEIVKFIAQNYLNIDQIPAGALTGDAQIQSQGQGQMQGQAQMQTQPQVQPEAQPESQPESQGQVQPEGQTQMQGQSQVQVQTQGQAQGQGQSQGQGQTQGQGQAQGQGEFEEVEEEGEDELPI